MSQKIYQTGEVAIKAADKGGRGSLRRRQDHGAEHAGRDGCLPAAPSPWTAAVISDYNAKQLTGYRRHDIGFVFQFYNLVQNLTALENVELAAQICRDPLDAATVLDEVGLTDRKDNFPAQLSGGEQQQGGHRPRPGQNPKLLLCDEPTGALDYQTGKAILKLLQDTCREKGRDGHRHYPQQRPDSHGGPGDPHPQRHRGGGDPQDHPTPVEEIEW